LLYCPICGRGFPHLIGLRHHFSSHHEVVASEASRSCPLCGRAFSAPRSLEYHAARKRDDAHVVWSFLRIGRTANAVKWKKRRALQLLRSGYRLELNIVGGGP
jgi:hypothetical protein